MARDLTVAHSVSSTGYGCSPGFDPLKPTPAQHNDHWAWTFGLGLGFGYNRLENATDYKSTQFILHTLVQAIALGGNLEMSLGPPVKVSRNT